MERPLTFPLVKTGDQVPYHVVLGRVVAEHHSVLAEEVLPLVLGDLPAAGYTATGPQLYRVIHKGALSS